MAQRKKQKESNSRRTAAAEVQLKPAFVFNLDLKSHPETFRQPAAITSVVNRSMSYTQLSPIQLWQNRWHGSGSVLGSSVSRRYSHFNSELGPIRRAVRFRRKQVVQGAQPDFDSYNDSDFDSYNDFASPAETYNTPAAPAPINRQYNPGPDSIAPTFEMAPQTAFDTDYADDYNNYAEPAYQAAEPSPLASQVASFEPVTMRNLSAVEPVQPRQSQPNRSRIVQRSNAAPASESRASNANIAANLYQSFERAQAAAQMAENNASLTAQTPTNNGRTAQTPAANSQVARTIAASATPLLRSLAQLQANQVAEAADAPVTSADLHRPALSYARLGGWQANRTEISSDAAQTVSAFEPAAYDAYNMVARTQETSSNFAAPVQPVAPLAQSTLAANEQAPEQTPEQAPVSRTFNTTAPASVFQANASFENSAIATPTGLNYSVAQRPTMESWNSGLSTLQLNPGIVSRVALPATDNAAVPAQEQAASPRLRMSWHSSRVAAPSFAAVAESASPVETRDPVTLANTTPSLADFAPALQRSLSTLTTDQSGHERVERMAAPTEMSQAEVARQPMLPGTGLIDRSQAALAAAQPAYVSTDNYATTPATNVLARSAQANLSALPELNGLSQAQVGPASALARVFERAETVSDSMNSDYAAVAASQPFAASRLSYARPGGNPAQTPAANYQGYEGAGEVARASYDAPSFNVSPSEAVAANQLNNQLNNQLSNQLNNQLSNQLNVATPANRAETENVVARFYQPLQAAQETIARLYQSQFQPTLAPLASLPGFEAARAAQSPAQAQAGNWGSGLSALQFNPGVGMRAANTSAASEGASANTTGNAPAPVARTFAIRQSNAPASSRTNDFEGAVETSAFQPAFEAPANAPVRNGADNAATELGRTILRSLGQLGQPQEIGARLQGWLSEANGTAGAANNPFAPVGQSRLQMNLSQNMSQTANIAEGAAQPTPIQRLMDRAEAAEARGDGQTVHSDFGNLNYDYATPPLTLRKVGDYAPALNSVMREMSGVTQGEGPDINDLMASFAVSREFALPAQTANTANWSSMNYSDPARLMRLPEVSATGNTGFFAMPAVQRTAARTQANQPGNNSAVSGNGPLSMSHKLTPSGRPQTAINGLNDTAGDFAAEAADTYEPLSMSHAHNHAHDDAEESIGVIGIPQPMIQRKASNASTPAPIARAFNQVMRTSVGQRLDSGIQRRMNNIFGANLEHVRVHTDAPATEYATRMGAEAFTVGSSIYFAPGRYQPNSTSGQALIGHELTHVMQQASLPSLGGGRIPETSSHGQAMEHEALGNERLLLQHLTSQNDHHENDGHDHGSVSRSFGGTMLNLSTPAPQSSPVQRVYEPVEPVHLKQESHSEAGSGAGGDTSIQRAMMSEGEAALNRFKYEQVKSSLGQHDEVNEPKINMEEMAELVFRMLKHRMIVERERGGPNGGKFF